MGTNTLEVAPVQGRKVQRRYMKKDVQAHRNNKGIQLQCTGEFMKSKLRKENNVWIKQEREYKSSVKEVQNELQGSEE